MKTNIDTKSKAFLRAVADANGSANLSEIREMTGLDNEEANYRFRKLERLDLINVERPMRRTRAEPHPPKVAHLTETAEELLAAGLYDEAETVIVEHEMARRVEEMEQRIALLEDRNYGVHERLSSLERFRARMVSLINGDAE